MNFIESDEFLAMVVPLAVYWIYSGFYEIFGSFEKYRLHSRKDEETKNLVSKQEVIKGVLLQQIIQATIALILFKVPPLVKIFQVSPTTVYMSVIFIYHQETTFSVVTEDDQDNRNTNPHFAVVATQFLIAMFVLDTWQYFVHRYMHLNKFFYRNFHSWHHRLAAPYAYGAQYNHPIDGILTETVAGALAFFTSGMSPRTSIFFFSFATIKGIDDHCGLLLPWNPFHIIFGNNTAYHDIHHQLGGNKYNFAQPFFVFWDKILGTYVPYKLERREGGGYEARIAKVACD